MPCQLVLMDKLENGWAWRAAANQKSLFACPLPGFAFPKTEWPIFANVQQTVQSAETFFRGKLSRLDSLLYALRWPQDDWSKLQQTIQFAGLANRASLSGFLPCIAGLRVLIKLKDVFDLQAYQPRDLERQG